VSLVEPGGFRTAIFDEVSRDVARREGSPYSTGYQRSLDLLRLATPFLGDPDLVARLVGRILRDPHPRARYLVGVDAQAAALAGAATPTFLRDLVTRKVLGL
jgi:NAD(P)-dependent dehydrogenase (short-subunit alcohol dehydrogenase family)